MGNRPLEGMKILDFTYLLPGPFGTMMLADLGADIIKVENPANPDMMRLVPPHVDGISAAYAHVNRGKKSMALNLKLPGAVQIIHALMKEYDIIIEQFRPGVMEKFGLGYGDLSALKPSLIYCSLTGYGQSGPYSHRAGHDINYLALSGIDSYSGRPGQGPALSGIQIADLAGGSKNLCIAVMAAYIGRLTRGKGDYIDISMTDSVFSLSMFETAGFLAGEKEPMPGEKLLNGGSFYDYYITSDGRYISVGSIEPKFFSEFLKALGLENLVESMILSADEAREAKKEVARRIAARPLVHWIDVFGKIDACVEPVRTLSEAVSSPPLSERDMIVTMKDGNGRSFRQIANPIKFASGSCNAPEPGTDIGSHTDEILTGIGKSPGEIEKLRQSGVVA